MMWPLSLHPALDHARRKRDPRSDVVDVPSKVIWHMVFITTDLDAITFSTLSSIFIVFRLEHLLSFGVGNIQSKPSFVLVVHDAGGIDSEAR